jgi:hypothetical protein
MSSGAIAFMSVSILLIFSSAAVTLTTLLTHGKKNDK